jgi:SPOR domain
MSTNDDSASRRGRRADQGDRRGPARQDRDERWEQSLSHERAVADLYQDQRGRDTQQQRGGYSNFSRHAYPNQPDPTLPQPQGYYPDPVQRNDSARPAEPAGSAYTPPPPPYEPEPPHLSFQGSGRDDLFARESGASAYGHNPYGAQGAGYQGDPYEQNRGQQPITPASNRREEPQYQREAPSPADDYDRNFQARSAQEAQASRFFLPEEEPHQQRASQADRGYTAPPSPPPPQYPGNTYPPQDNYDTHFEDSWADEHALREDDGGGMNHDLVAQENELDEDFFADEDELESDHIPAPKRSRKRLMFAMLAMAMAVGGGGAYFYKSLKGGSGEESATPFIRADNRPLKELPGNPGGKQFPNGEKTIYDRLTPDGQQIQAAAYAPPTPVAPPAVQAAQGNSLEERIDEALRKAQQASDAPQQPAQPATRGPDQPTMVRSESYRPDGTRVDGGRPTTSANADVNGGQLPPPFGTATQGTLSAQPAAAPFHTVPVPSSPTAAAAPAQRNATAPAGRSASLTPAEPTATPSNGFWVSLKSAPDEKAIQRDLTMLTDKYKSVLGDVQLSSKIADLGAKGVTYRAVAGPLSSRQEAMDLCQKIKGVGGDKACFVTN